MDFTLAQPGNHILSLLDSEIAAAERVCMHELVHHHTDHNIAGTRWYIALPYMMSA